MNVSRSENRMAGSQAGSCWAKSAASTQVSSPSEASVRSTGCSKRCSATEKGAESIREQALKTIKSYQREIDEIKAKLKMLREAASPDA